MLDGYPLRKYDWKDWLLMLLSSSFVLQVVFSLGMAGLGPVIMTTFFNTAAVFTDFEQWIFKGTVYGAVASLPLTLLVIHWRRIPLFNRKQRTKEESFLIRGLTKKDWQFLLKYIPVSYFLYVLGQNVLAQFVGVSEPVNQMAVESLFDYVPVWQMFIMIVIVAPITEELLFRGLFLFPGDRLEASWLRVFLSAALFGLAHNPTDLLSLYTYVGMGFVLAYAAKRTGTVEASMVYHFLNNLLGFLVIVTI